MMAALAKSVQHYHTSPVEAAEIAAQAGVDAYLIKPFTEDELAEHIQQLTSLRGVA